VIAPIASTNAIEASRASMRPATIFSTRDEQRINIIPDKSARSKKIAESRSADRDLRPLHAERQLVTVSPRIEYGCCCSAATGDLTYPVLA
jgi:hypothetical protein